MRFVRVFLTAMIALSTVASAQEIKSGAKGAAPKVFSLSGMVGDEGKTLLSDKNDEWVVSNPEALKPEAGEQVTIRCRMDADHTSLHVISFKLDEVRYSANRGDSAFRR